MVKLRVNEIFQEIIGGIPGGIIFDRTGFHGDLTYVRSLWGLAYLWLFTADGSAIIGVRRRVAALQKQFSGFMFLSICT